LAEITAKTLRKIFVIQVFSRRIILSGLASLALTGCAAKQSPIAAAQINAQRSNEVELTQVNYQVITIGGLGQAVRAALAELPDIAAFGELHELRTPKPKIISTTQYFAREVIPVLKECGYLHLVLEHLPSGNDAAAEIENYRLTGQLGPYLVKELENAPDREGIIEMMRQAKENGIALYGAHAEGTPGIPLDLDDNETGPIIKKNMQKKLEELRNSGLKVASFGGTIHNKINPGLSEDWQSSVSDLSLNNRVKEIDIYPADYLAAYPGDPRSYDLPGWQQLVPGKGVKMINFPSGRSVLILPYQK